MVSKCRAPVSEIAVMELDVVRPTTTARSPPTHFGHLSSSSSNKRKNLAAGPDFDFSSTTTTFVRLQSSRRRRLVWPENSVSTPPITEEITTATSSPTSGSAASAFICSSGNGCGDVVEESHKFVDLADENEEHEVVCKSSGERRESTPSSQFRSTQSGAMESPPGKSDETSGKRSLSSSSAAKMPAESELEEFFITAEKNIQKRFAEKYNYNIVEDVPTEGRYKWIQLKHRRR